MDSALNGVANLNDSLLRRNLNPYKGTLRSEAKSGDSLSIGILTPEKTQAILNRELADKLEQRFKEEGIELKGLKADDFTPQKVSERILGFVSGRILSEQDSERQQQLMEQARAGIEQGFAEARDILESLSVLNGKVKEDIDTTYDLIQQGLDNLSQKISGEQPDADLDKDAQVLTGEVEQASLQSRFSRSESTRVEIMTNEGDKILVELFKSQTAEQQTRVNESEKEHGLNYYRSISASVGLSYQVDGDLNSDEQKAIDELLANVAEVSERFFSGDVQKAFNYAQNMDFDTRELTQFSLDMSYQETRQVAISTYSGYQPQASDTAPAEGAPALHEASKFIRELDELLHNPFAQQNFAEPRQSVSELLKAMNEQLYSENMSQLQQDSTALLDSLVEQLKQFHGAQGLFADTDNGVVSA